MNNDLEQFSEETLQRLISGEYFPSTHAAKALARIALAAKRAEPVGYLCEWDNGNQVIYYGEAGNALDDDWSSQPSVHKNLPLYTTPQLNHPVSPEGWKLVPIEPTQSMVDAHISGMQLAGFSRAYRDMLAAAPEPQNQQQNIPEIIPQGWIKCSDQMPEDDEYYLTHSTAGVDVTIFHDGRFQDEYATHWMPLPAAPEKSL
ncbi:DUF551 domain-containing protein [Yersinia enterocolitica]|nr:DUF551 domain-containing protein [Yersinia enterocolitica]